MTNLHPAWSLVTCRVEGTDYDIAAVLLADGRIVQPDALVAYAGLVNALEDWTELAAELRDLDVEELDVLTGASTIASLHYPRKVLCVGANYRDHIAEMGADLATLGPWQPFFFAVPPTTTIIGDGQSIEIPADPSFSVDWEAELALVIGVGGHDIPLDEAIGHIAGYACFSDITARGLLRRHDAFAEPFRWDWAGSKGMDTFCPIGAVTPAWMVDDPNDLRIRCLVNGVTKQDSSTSNFIVEVAEVVVAASRSWTLEPGDVIATGTPAGVGFPRGERLQTGDEVRVEIDGLVPLTNPVATRAALRQPTPAA